MADAPEIGLVRILLARLLIIKLMRTDGYGVRLECTHKKISD